MIATNELIEKVYAFCEAISGQKLFPYQSIPAKRLIRSLLEGDGETLSNIWSRQCIPEDQYVYMSDGSHKMIKDIKIGDKIISINIDDKKESDIVMDKWSTGKRDRLLIKTRRGYSIECSPNHLFYTPQGWREAGKLKTYVEAQVKEKRHMILGDYSGWRHQRVCSSIEYGVFGSNVVGKDMARFLGYMLSDGQYSSSTVKFTNINNQYLDEIEKLVIKEFPSSRIDKIPKGNGFDYYFRTDTYGENDVIDFFKKIEIYGQTKEQRRIPKFVQTLCKEDLKEFINRLWAGDGYLTGGEDGGTNVEIGIGIPSYHYSMDVILLLNKFGIGARLEEQKNGKKQKSRFWKIRISRSEDVIRFLSEIGDIYGKEEQSQRVRKFAESRQHHTVKYETSNDVSWDTITSIEKLAPIEMYDIRTLKNHNFVCNGFIVHNSGKSFTISFVSAGISIILPILANMPMFANDKRLKKFKNGFSEGIFAPALHQSQIIFGNIKKHLASDAAAEVLSDPEINVGFSTFNGQNITLKFNNLGISSTISCMSASDNSNIVGASFMLIICDESQDISNSKYLSDIGPMGAFYNATNVLIGTPTITRGFFFDIIEKNKKDYQEGTRYRNHFEYDYKTVIQYNENYRKYIEKEKKKLGETSDAFKMSYALQWIFERGMFIDPEKFDRMLDNSRGRVIYDHEKTHVVGIDLGKAQDSTVVTVGEVDLDNPTIIEENEFKDVPSYAIYDVTVKDWLEITGDNWDEQYYAILSYLSNFKISRIVIDATSVGSHMFDRLNNAVSCEVIPFVFSTPSKSDLYKNFDSYIKNSRYHIPADIDAQETMEYKRCCQQMLDMEKTYNGQYLVCKHPATKTGRDDYCDSSALMVWGAKGEITTPQSSDNNPFLETKYQGTYMSRNRFTGRRR